VRIIVTGSRKWKDFRTIYDALDLEYAAWLPTRRPGEMFIVVHGKAKGADTIAKEWAQTKGGYADEEGHEAHWDLLGLFAGEERNGRMVAKGANKCLGFPIGIARGTRNCMRLAREAGIPVQRFRPEKGAA